MAINKIEFDGNTLIDLSTDTVTSSDDIAFGKVGHLNDGSMVTGTYSGTEPVIQSLSVTSNGTYTAPEGVDGFSPVTVNTDPEKGFVFFDFDENMKAHKIRLTGNWTNIPDNYFNKPTGLYLNSPGAKIEEITFPQSLKVIGRGAFYSVNSLKYAHFNEGLEQILGGLGSAYGAFNTTGLVETIFPQSLTAITDVGAFSGCSSMTKVVFNGDVCNFSSSIFKNCPKIALYDFSNHSGNIPTLYSVDSLGHATGCVIKVPQSLLTEWQSATNWADLTDVEWQGV